MAAQKKMGPPAPNPVLEAFLGRKRDAEGNLIPRKAKSKTVAASRFSKTIGEARAMIDSGDWDGFAARHVVALYDIMHEKCYGVAPAMMSKARYTATMAAATFVKTHFGGDFDDAVEYFRWLWDREIGREAWARSNGKERHTRLGFWLTINPSMLTDYYVALERKRGRA